MTDRSVLIRPMREADLAEADRVYRLAFGTQFGLPDPSRFRGDSQVIRLRWTADPRPCFVAETDGRIVGSIIGMDWGSVFVLGPLTVDPAHAGGGIGRRLIEPVMDFVAAQQFKLAGLFTFPHSPKHIHLYESYGFVPQRLTPVLSKATEEGESSHHGWADPAHPPHPSLSPFQGERVAKSWRTLSLAKGEPYSELGEGVALFSNLASPERAAALAACRAVSHSVFPGLDLTREIEAITAQRIGEAVLLRAGDSIAGFALCHIGAGSEAGSGILFVKFACVRSGGDAGFVRLVEACEALAGARGLARIVAGVNRGRDDAYRLLRELGFRADLIGVAMHRPDGPGYNRPEVYAIDDWR